jgi:hypothetical protein
VERGEAVPILQPRPFEFGDERVGGGEAGRRRCPASQYKRNRLGMASNTPPHRLGQCIHVASPISGRVRDANVGHHRGDDELFESVLVRDVVVQRHGPGPEGGRQ